MTERTVRRAQKDLRHAYREAAMQLRTTPISVSPHAHVQMCEAGAYVEVHVWIPKDAASGGAHD